MLVKTIMTKDVLKTEGGTTVKEAADIMKKNNVGSLLIGTGEEITGIVTETDIVQRVVAVDLSPYTTTVEAVMSSPVVAVEADMPVREASTLMSERRVRHLVVTEEGMLVGMVSARDLLHPQINPF